MMNHFEIKECKSKREFYDEVYLKFKRLNEDEEISVKSFDKKVNGIISLLEHLFRDGKFKKELSLIEIKFIEEEINPLFEKKLKKVYDKYKVLFILPLIELYNEKGIIYIRKTYNKTKKYILLMIQR